MNNELLSPAEITADTKMRDLAETRSCGRCGGSGYFGPMSVNAGRCFRCGGIGRTNTKRGAAAIALFRSMRSAPASTLRPGDRLYMQSGPLSGGGWTTVDEVIDVAAEPERAGSCSLYQRCDTDKIAAAVERGATILPYESDPTRVRVYSGLRIKATRRNGEGYGLHTEADSPVTVAIDRDVFVAMLKTVAEYQATLTQAGKPRKGTRWAA